MSDLIQRHENVYAPVIGFDSEVEIVSARGTHVTDLVGNDYLDFACGISVLNLGHNHPAVSAAAKTQLERLWHAGGAFRYESLIDAAERLVDIAPPGINMAFFMNSGAEAVEASVKMARYVTGRQGVIVFRGGFHGRTMGSVTYTTSKAKYRHGYMPLLPSVFVTPFPHPYAWNMSQDDAVDRCIDELDLLFRHEVFPEDVAAMLIEPLQGEGGYYPAGQRFLRHLRRLADDNGILLIHDEIQCGFGRTGAWFASSLYGVEPDVMVVGKAIANGLPLSGVTAKRKLLEQWPPGSHGSTFGGNPVSCAAAAAAIDALRQVVPTVAAKSEHAFGRWQELATRHPVIGDVRGEGLMIGVEMVDADGAPDPRAFKHLSAYARDHGLLILSCGPNSNIIRFIPPLNVSYDDLDRGIDILAAGLAAHDG